jgi:hypothetical protein
MRKPLLFASLLVAALSAGAAGQKPCEELKAEIAKKLDANGVKSYSLDIVAKDKEADGKVVGSCDGGTKKIVYQRGGAPAAKPTPAPAKQ